MLVGRVMSVSTDHSCGSSKTLIHVTLSYHSHQWSNIPRRPDSSCDEEGFCYSSFPRQDEQYHRSKRDEWRRSGTSGEIEQYPAYQLHSDDLVGCTMGGFKRASSGSRHTVVLPDRVRLEHFHLSIEYADNLLVQDQERLSAAVRTDCHMIALYVDTFR